MIRLDSLIQKRDKLERQIADLVSEERASLRKQIKALDRLSGRGHRRHTMNDEARKKTSQAQKRRHQKTKREREAAV